jgi:hypothetical protein
MDAEISVMNDSISSKNKKIGAIERNKLGVSSNSDLAKEVGPLKYIADLTGKSLEQVVNWYIIVLMLVFDPLAIALVIAANFAFEMSKDKEEEEIKEEDTEMKENRLKTLWKKIFKKENQIEEDEVTLVNNEQPNNENLIVDEFTTEELGSDEKIWTEDLNLFSEETVIEEPKIVVEPVSIITAGENIEDVENKVEEKDKYRDSNLSIEKQKIIRERFRNNPGSDPLKLR